MVSVTAKGRCRLGTYSEASAAAFGIAPPSPSPARNRKTPSITTPSTAAIASVGTANDSTLQRSAVRRPMRSPSMPPAAPPIIMPSGPSASTVVNGARGSDHSLINAGMTLPSSWLSMPSRMIASAVPATSSF